MAFAPAVALKVIVMFSEAFSTQPSCFDHTISLLSPTVASFTNSWSVTETPFILVLFALYMKPSGNLSFMELTVCGVRLPLVTTIVYST